MTILRTIVISGAVEGLLDEAVLRRLIEHVGARPGPIHGKNGKAHLRQRLRGYNEAARLTPWLVLVDLDADAHCAPPLQALWLPDPAPYMCFRIAVRMTEAWILADRDRLSRFLGVAMSKIPLISEVLGNPKQTMVELAKLSRRRQLREDLVPRPGSGRVVGPAYASRLIEFVVNTGIGWRPDVAASSSDSLKRCLHRLRDLVGSWK